VTKWNETRQTAPKTCRSNSIAERCAVQLRLHDAAATKKRNERKRAAMTAFPATHSCEPKFFPEMFKRRSSLLLDAKASIVRQRRPCASSSGDRPPGADGRPSKLALCPTSSPPWPVPRWDGSLTYLLKSRSRRRRALVLILVEVHKKDDRQEGLSGTANTMRWGTGGARRAFQGKHGDRLIVNGTDHGLGLETFSCWLVCCTEWTYSNSAIATITVLSNQRDGSFPDPLERIFEPDCLCPPTAEVRASFARLGLKVSAVVLGECLLVAPQSSIGSRLANVSRRFVQPVSLLSFLPFELA
jgi:hypothetical protein